MRKLEIDFDEIASLMESDFDLYKYYLDTHTGETVVVPYDLLDSESFDTEEIENLPKWERELVPVVQEILEGDRYEPIPRVESYQVYDLMAEFAETVSNRRLQRLLSVALDGKGAFGRFKRVMENYPEERERWFKFKLAEMSKWIREWLNDLDIEPVQKKYGS